MIWVPLLDLSDTCGLRPSLGGYSQGETWQPQLAPTDILNSSLSMGRWASLLSSVRNGSEMSLLSEPWVPLSPPPLFNEHMLNACSVPGRALGATDIIMNNTLPLSPQCSSVICKEGQIGTGCSGSLKQEHLDGRGAVGEASRKRRCLN